jgi:hypothetical protein
MNDLNIILVVIILILLYIQSCSKINDRFEANTSDIKPAGYAASFYIDHYKFMIIKENQEPMVLFDAVNTFHTGDMLYVQCNENGNDCPMFQDPYGTNYLQDTGRCRKIESKDAKLIWVPVAKIISVMEVDAFAVIVLDAAVNISGRKLGVGATPESAALWKTTIYPDANKTPVTEIMSMSRWQV